MYNFTNDTHVLAGALSFSIGFDLDCQWLQVGNVRMGKQAARLQGIRRQC
ncbi:MAG: hypothetical protein ACI9MR_000921 [Myxococcota bacterium]|jgi:hypothetical protein